MLKLYGKHNIMALLTRDQKKIAGQDFAQRQFVDKNRVSIYGANIISSAMDWLDTELEALEIKLGSLGPSGVRGVPTQDHAALIALCAQKRAGT
jgi:hypothetical protein